MVIEGWALPSSSYLGEYGIYTLSVTFLGFSKFGNSRYLELPPWQQICLPLPYILHDRSESPYWCRTEPLGSRWQGDKIGMGFLHMYITASTNVNLIMKS